jgi:hypothetical protein
MVKFINSEHYEEKCDIVDNIFDHPTCLKIGQIRLLMKHNIVKVYFILCNNDFKKLNM